MWPYLPKAPAPAPKGERTAYEKSAECAKAYVDTYQLRSDGVIDGPMYEYTSVIGSAMTVRLRSRRTENNREYDAQGFMHIKNTNSLVDHVVHFVRRVDKVETRLKPPTWKVTVDTTDMGGFDKTFAELDEALGYQQRISDTVTLDTATVNLHGPEEPPLIIVHPAKRIRAIGVKEVEGEVYLVEVTP